MASVKKFPASKYWYACYKQPTGRLLRNGLPEFKRIQASTKTTDQREALSLALAYERAAEQVANKRWQDRSAHAFLAQIHAITGTSTTSIHAEAFFNEWLKLRKKISAEKSYKNIEHTIYEFLTFLGPAAKSPIGDIDASTIDRYRSLVVGNGLALNTWNKKLSFLRQALSEAVTQGALDKNPTEGMRIHGAGKKAQKRKHFTFQEFKSLIQVTAIDSQAVQQEGLNSEWQTFILTAAYTGGRQQEVAKADWAGVNFAKRVITLNRTKTADNHWIPMHPSLVGLLFKHWEQHNKPTTGAVFPKLSTASVQELSKDFRERVLPLIGIDQPYVKAEKNAGFKRKLAEYGLHSLRHSLATWLHEAGVAEDMRMQLVGHADARVSRNYTHINISQAAAALAKVPQL